MHSDLAILSAAQYEGGAPHGVQRHRVRAQRKSPASAVAEGPAPKKRSRTQSSAEQEEADDDKKRARGRPRLDTTDQTPQDRRRTQIRLAQRAYRNRKESAITTLEKEVEDLKEVNDQMSQAYRDLFDFATRKGLLEQAPEFGQRLLRLEALTKRSAEYAYGNDDEAESDSTTPPSKRPGRKVNGGTLPENPVRSSLHQQQPQPLWGGVIVTHESTIESEQQYNQPLADVNATHQELSAGYEIIAQPTLQNASFAPNMTFDETFLMNSWDPSPWTSLPNPTSFAYQEITFGRRLQRTALQRAAKLLTMDNPPPDKMMRVFGIARLFETYEQIKERTLASLAHSTAESLSYWKYPVSNLGGAGTHFETLEAGSSDPKVNTSKNSLGQGNSAGQSSRRSKETNPFYMGPLEPRVSEVKASLLGIGDQVKMPGFDGVFWDCDEVDFYLSHNGVTIPPLVDHCVVEIVDGAFNHSSGQAPYQPQTQMRTQEATPSSSVSAASFATVRTNSMAAPSTGISSPVSSAEIPAISSNAPDDSWPSRSTSNAGIDFFNQGYGQMASGSALTAFDSSITAASITAAFTDPTLAFAPGDEHSLLSSLSQHSHEFNQGQDQAGRRTWTIDVEKFVEELVSKATCLGRTPGFRPKDVDLAFWASVVDPSAM